MIQTRSTNRLNPNRDHIKKESIKYENGESFGLNLALKF